MRTFALSGGTRQLWRQQATGKSQGRRELGGGAIHAIWEAESIKQSAAEANEPWLRPYTGPTRTDVDASTLDGKVLCGYQGWFNTPGDGTNFGFTHWGRGLNNSGGGRFTVD